MDPNVFYELGLCDVIGKRIISICSRKSYEGYTNLKKQMLKRIDTILGTHE
jgi:hypothetical protein